MQFKGEKIAKNMSNYTVTLSPRELAKWGRAFGYATEEVFAVDTHVGETYDSAVGLGPHGSDSARDNVVLYSTTYSVITDTWDRNQWSVEFTVKGKKHEGETQWFDDDARIQYKYGVERKSYFRDAVDKFVRDLIKDGHLSFYPVEDLDEAMGN